MMLRPRRRHHQSAHDMEVQGVRFRQARILRDLPPEDSALLGLVDDAYSQDIARDKLQRVLLGQYAETPLVEQGDDARQEGPRS